MLDEFKLKRRFPKTTHEDPRTTRRLDRMAEAYRNFAQAIDDSVKDGRLKSIAMTNLETSAMYASKAIVDEVTHFDA